MNRETAERIIKTMTQRQNTLATCESLTGGGVGAALTSIPGSSAVYRGGLITYARDLKSDLAGVSETLIRTEGVVNEQTALEMALGAQRVCQADWAIATTGVAGPTMLDGAEVGTVWLAVVGPRHGMSSQAKFTSLVHLPGDREQVREATVDAILAMLLRVLSPTG